MKEQERVFELVKKGIITTEEALVLLENMATEKDVKTVTKEAGDIKNTVKKTINPVENDYFYTEDTLSFEEEKEQAEKARAASEQEDKQRLERLLAQLTQEANNASAELDNVCKDIEVLESKINAKKEELMVLNTLSDLEELTEEQQAKSSELHDIISTLELEMNQLSDKKTDLEIKLSAINKEKKETRKDTPRFEIPEDWEESINEFGQKVGEAGSHFGKKMGEAGVQLGRFFKDTIKTVNENVDWKDINIKVPGLSSSSFKHEFYYPEMTASLIDVKVANGEVSFIPWDSEDLKVEADVKLYGKMEADTPFEAFLERSQILVDEEQILFHIPNKRIKADLNFYLPRRVYDHVSVKLLNGDVTVSELEAKDIFVKSTNGDMTFNSLIATMLEVEGVNGNVAVSGGKVMDFLSEAVNGDYSLQGNIENISVSNVNGDVKITGTDSLAKVEASVVNGTLKLALPESLGVDGMVKTSLGTIKNRLTDFEVIREKADKTNQLLQFRRYNEDKTAYIRLNTTTGSIYMKDTEQ